MDACDQCPVVSGGGRMFGCSIKAVGVPCSTPGVQCCGGGGGRSIKADGVPCSTPGVQCCGGGGGIP